MLGHNAKRMLNGPINWEKMGNNKRTKLSARDVANFGRHPADILDEEIAAEPRANRIMTWQVELYPTAYRTWPYSYGLCIR